jgi:hypothetical protein
VKVIFTPNEGRFLQENDVCRLATCSLKRLAALPDPTRIFPNHEGESTIGEEKTSNPFLLSESLNQAGRTCGRATRLVAVDDRGHPARSKMDRGSVNILISV